ncbi:shikimate dehydrogenase [Actinophytocola sp.]|uniref:shikimate dehydrogenase n=1 Tax=Actinophytocola sp. TaxID=1872138 RepID=UPI002D810D7B|nr:shikimate dehydrogenase [Actinophytocola sp.]HET9139057.1 shikimate dehydrogenase [Actinophytocola sp.]
MPDRYLIGLIGADIGTSASPALHEHEADRLGLRYQYRLLDLEVLGRPAGEILAAARLAGYDGLNITHPAKQLVLGQLDALSPDAAALGAVNTVVFRGGRAIGHNTDLPGFARSLSVGLPDAALDRVVLLGAGGAGAAVAHALLSLGAGTVTIFDTAPQRAETLADSLSVHFGPNRAGAGRLDDGGATLAGAVHAADGLAHATPTGMRGHPGLPLPADLLRPGLWVTDVVYRPLDTALVRAARARGCRVLDGGPMVVYQAAAAFQLFTGVAPDVDRMLRHFDAIMPERRETHAHR